MKNKDLLLEDVVLSLFMPIKRHVSFYSNRFRAMFNVMEMPMDWPAEVNYHEAKAFCAWKGSDYRLPTEAEHHVMRGPQVSQCLAQIRRVFI